MASNSQIQHQVLLHGQAAPVPALSTQNALPAGTALAGPNVNDAGAIAARVTTTTVGTKVGLDVITIGGSAVGTVFTHTASQDLALASLNTTTAFAATNRPSFMAMVFRDGAGVRTALPGDQTLTITYDSGDGANFDTFIEQITLATGTTDFFFSFPSDTVMDSDDEVNVTLTNTGTPAITVYVTVRAQD